MTQLDTRFLAVHPRTVLWWEQREQCRRCKHMHENPHNPRRGGGATGGGWTCMATKEKGPMGRTSCIDARDGVCGPEARLFEEKR